MTAKNMFVLCCKYCAKQAIKIAGLLSATTIALLIPQFAIASNDTPNTSPAGLSITPPTVEILLAPNKNVIQTFNLKNQGESAQFVASLHTFEPQGMNGLGTVNPRPLDPTSLPILVSLENADIKLNKPFTLTAGESQQLVLHIEAANVDTTQDAYFALVVTTVEPASETVRGIVGISTLLFVTVTPDGVLPLDLSIEGFTLPYIVDSMSTLKFNVSLKNNTPVLIRPEGQIAIISPQGVARELPIYPNLILGSSSREIRVKANDDQSPPEPAQWVPGKSAIGPHLVRVTITTPSGRKIQEVEKTVWVLPVKLTLAIGSTMLLSIMFTFISRRKRPIDTP